MDVEFSKVCLFFYEFQKHACQKLEIRSTEKALLTALKDNLYEVLRVRSDVWDKQIEEDIKVGKLDHLREEILEDIQAGRLTDL